MQEAYVPGRMCCGRPKFFNRFVMANWLIFINFLKIFAAACLMPKINIKIAWHESNVVNISWVMSTLFLLKILQFWNNLNCCTFHAQKIRKNIISNLSNSVSAFIQNHFLQCFYVFIGYWRAQATRISIVIDIFLVFLKSVTPKLNLCSAHSRRDSGMIWYPYCMNTGAQWYSG